MYLFTNGPLRYRTPCQGSAKRSSFFVFLTTWHFIDKSPTSYDKLTSSKDSNHCIKLDEETHVMHVIREIKKKHSRKWPSIHLVHKRHGPISQKPVISYLNWVSASTAIFSYGFVIQYLKYKIIEDFFYLLKITIEIHL